ncbi:MAG TPA: restriction endonuclease [Phycisphaerae bacterium]|nr:restriction endonuclease [Phycisphaerae bacterium]
MPRAGRERERLVQHFERLLATCKQASIESPGYLRDRITGRTREFDVLITLPWGVVIAFEVRDRRRKTDVTEIEGFAAKTKDVQVTDKVFVSSSGFTEPALKKAAANGIQCRTVQEAQALKWVSSGFFELVSTKRPSDVWYHLIPFNEKAAMAEAQKLGFSKPTLQNTEVINANGQVLDWNAIGAKAWKKAQDQEAMKRTAKGQIKVLVDFAPSASHFMRWKGSLAKFQLERIEVTFKYKTKTETIPHHLRQYSDEPRGEVLADAVESESFPALGAAVKLVMAGEPGKPKTVALLRQPKKK